MSKSAISRATFVLSLDAERLRVFLNQNKAEDEPVSTVCDGHLMPVWHPPTPPRGHVPFGLRYPDFQDDAASYGSFEAPLYENHAPEHAPEHAPCHAPFHGTESSMDRTVDRAPVIHEESTISQPTVTVSQ